MEAKTWLPLAGLVLGTVALLFARDVAARLASRPTGYPGAVRVLGLLVAVASAGVLTLDNLMPGLCATEVWSEVPQPGGPLRATIHTYDCGATTPYAAVHLSLLGPGESPPTRGNAFRSFRRSGAPAEVLEAEVRWTSPVQLTLEHHADLEVGLAETRVKGVQVTYDARWR